MVDSIQSLFYRQCVEKILLQKKLQEHLARHSLKSTRQRDIITSVFFDAVGEHVTIEGLLEKVRVHDSKASYATVYRTLMLLVEAGVAHQRQFEDGQSRFELVTDQHHDHLICTSCHKIIEFENDEIEKMQVVIAQNYQFKLTGHKHELYGLCVDCSAA